MTRQLYYFNTKGFGEGARYILHYGGLEFEDIRMSHGDWQKEKEKIHSPFGKLPLYKEGNITIHQSSVIARYIGRQIGLVPSDPVKEAQADIVVQTMFDFFNLARGFWLEKDEAKKEELKKVIINENVPFYFSRFDKQLAENNGYFTGELTWADIVFTAQIETFLDFLPSDVLTKYTNIKNLINKVHNLKGIKSYIASRPT